MISINSILERADVKELLHRVLTDKRFTNKLSTFSPHGEDYVNNQYSLLIVMDALIKFSIIIDDKNLLESYILQLRRILKKLDSHRDIIYGVNKLLVQVVSAELQITDPDTEENKKKILEYVYDKYIINGYCFHSFPSIFQNKVQEFGIDPLNYDLPVNKLKQMKYIFANHGYPEVIVKDLEDNPHITITDSPAMAYYYAFASPKYISDLVATNKYLTNENLYDRSAYYQKDYVLCRDNLINFCKHCKLSLNEGSIIIKNFVSEWNRLDLSNSKPCIAFIKRSAVDRNYLNDYRKILENSKDKDIVYSVASILESRFTEDKRYTPLNTKEIKIEIMPSYRDIFINQDVFEEIREKQQVIRDENNIEDLRNKIDPNYLKIAVNNYGKSTIMALVGALLIALGATIMILFTYYKR